MKSDVERIRNEDCAGKINKTSCCSINFSVMLIDYRYATNEVVPQSNVGVLSAMHQRALNAATVKAVEQAGVDEMFVGSESIYLDIKAMSSADLGKQHVSGAVTLEFETRGANFAGRNLRATWPPMDLKSLKPCRLNS